MLWIRILLGISCLFELGCTSIRRNIALSKVQESQRKWQLVRKNHPSYVYVSEDVGSIMWEVNMDARVTIKDHRPVSYEEIILSEERTEIRKIQPGEKSESLTLDGLYKACETEALADEEYLKNFEVELFPNGLIKSCTSFRQQCEDDCGEGFTLHSLEFLK